MKMRPLAFLLIGLFALLPLSLVFAATEVATSSATDIVTDAATLNGELISVSTQGATVKVYFEWGTFSWGASQTYENKTPEQTLTAPGPFTARVTGLKPDPTYHFRAVAVDQASSTPVYGGENTFKTGQQVTEPPPDAKPVAVNTVAASDIKSDSVTLKGELSSIGSGLSLVQVYFEWGLTSSYGSSSTMQSKDVAGPFTAAVTGLTPGSTYYFRAAATQAAGGSKVFGKALNFVTPKPELAALVSREASEVTSVSAILNGAIGSLTIDGPVQVWFDWGTSTAYEKTTLPQTITSAAVLKETVDGLTPGTAYYFRPVAFVNGVAVKGTDMSFTTVAGPAASSSGLSEIPIAWIALGAILLILIVLLLVLAFSPRKRAY